MQHVVNPYRISDSWRNDLEANTFEMVQAAAVAAVSRRARHAVILDLRELAAFTDFFVVCSGNSDTQIEGISEAISEELEEKWNVRPWHQEGKRESDWILMDYIDFVVHVFLDEKRDYYNLERLWVEAPTIEVPDVEVAADDEYGDAYDDLADDALDVDNGEESEAFVADDFDDENGFVDSDDDRDENEDEESADDFDDEENFVEPNFDDDSHAQTEVKDSD